MKPTHSQKTLIASFTVDGEPVSKSRARFTKRGSKTFAYTPEKTKAGEERVAWTYRSLAKGVPSDPEIAYRVEMHFFNGTRQRRDVDNMVKLILDGLNGVAWVDDNQVTQIEARKSYVTKAEARTEVRLYKVGSLNPPKRKCPGQPEHGIPPASAVGRNQLDVPPLDTRHRPRGLQRAACDSPNPPKETQHEYPENPRRRP